MNFIDPTYLRSIADDLAAGAINKDNPAALPDGLAGIFEKALPPEQNVRERKRFLEFFSVWALLKKEVSATFVVPLLDGWSEEDILDYIARYSKWFNSPESGKYVLFHERFRIFLLQKISESDVLNINQRIIGLCFSSLKNKQADEWECYALEHVSKQLLLSSMRSKFGGDELKKLAYDTYHWNRQIEISKGFNWSKNLLNDLMLWASKYDDDEVIECALNKVDLYRLEQDDAPHVYVLVAQNDIDIALQRIESFGGNDKEGLQRKFILYMLCLMELTLLKSKEQPWRKQAVEKLLKHLDEKMPINHNEINWGDFFSSRIMFKIALALDEMNLDYKILFKRAKGWQDTWKGQTKWTPEPNVDLQRQLNILLNILDLNNYILCISDNLHVITSLADTKKNSCIDDLLLRDELFSSTFDGPMLEIAHKLYKQCHKEKAMFVYEKLIENISKIDNSNYRLIKEFSVCLNFQEKQYRAKELEILLWDGFANFSFDQKIELARLLIEFYIIDNNLLKIVELIDLLPEDVDGEINRLEIYNRDSLVANSLQLLFRDKYNLEIDDVSNLVKILGKIKSASSRLFIIKGIINEDKDFKDDFDLISQILNMNPNNLAYTDNGWIAFFIFETKGRQSVHEFMNQIEDGYKRCLVLQEIIGNLGKKGAREDVLYFWNFLQNELEYLKDVNGKATIFSQISLLLIDYFEIDYVVGLINSMDVAWKRNSAKKEIIIKLLDNSNSLEVINKIIDKFELDRGNYCEIFIKMQNMSIIADEVQDVASVLFNYLKRYSILSISEEEKYNYLREIVQIVPNDISVKLVDQLNDYNKRNIVYYEIVKKNVNKFNTEESLKLIYRMQKGELKDLALSEIILKEYPKDSVTACNIIEKKLEYKSIKLYTEARIYNKYLDKTNRFEIVSFSNKIFVDYSEVIKSKNKYSNNALANVLSALLKIDEIEHAWRIYSFIIHGDKKNDTSVKIRCFMKLHQYYLDAGNVGEADKYFNLIFNDLCDEASLLRTNVFIKDLIIELIRFGLIFKAMEIYETKEYSVDTSFSNVSISDEEIIEIRILRCLMECGELKIAEDFLKRFFSTDKYPHLLFEYIKENINKNGILSLGNFTENIIKYNLKSQISIYLSLICANNMQFIDWDDRKILSSIKQNDFNEFIISLSQNIKIENLNRKKVLILLKTKSADTLTEAKLLQKYFIKKLILKGVSDNSLKRTMNVLNINWALELKKQP
jgi:hypothetical protein